MTADTHSIEKYAKASREPALFKEKLFNRFQAINDAAEGVRNLVAYQEAVQAKEVASIPLTQVVEVAPISEPAYAPVEVSDRGLDDHDATVYSSDRQLLNAQRNVEEAFEYVKLAA